VESGNLYILETRSTMRTAEAAIHIAINMVEEGTINEREAILRIDSQQMQNFLHQIVDRGRGRQFPNLL
jgi:pyruvate, orthophosphate dikinase